MVMHNPTTVLITKQNRFCKDAYHITEMTFGTDFYHFSGGNDDSFPEELYKLKPDYIFSFLSPWIIPKALLMNAGLAINWHPGSCEYPGTGCYNFALYEGAEEFGITCHHMAPQVDTGDIIEEFRFPVLENDTVETLKLRTMINLLFSFQGVMTDIAKNKKLPLSQVNWTRKPFTRKDLEELRVIRPDMNSDEVQRRIRATTYPKYLAPYCSISGNRFFYETPTRDPIV